MRTVKPILYLSSQSEMPAFCGFRQETGASRCPLYMRPHEQMSTLTNSMHSLPSRLLFVAARFRAPFKCTDVVYFLLTRAMYQHSIRVNIAVVRDDPAQFRFTNDLDTDLKRPRRSDGWTGCGASPPSCGGQRWVRRYRRFTWRTHRISMLCCSCSSRAR